MTDRLAPLLRLGARRERASAPSLRSTVILLCDKSAIRQQMQPSSSVLDAPVLQLEFQLWAEANAALPLVNARPQRSKRTSVEIGAATVDC